PAGGAAAGAAPAAAGAAAAGRGGAPGGGQLAAYPRGYKIEVSTDGTTWKTVEQGKGDSMYMSYMFDATPAKFVKITQTADDPTAPAWGMRFLKLYALGG
ncbi:MAG: sorbosone dehydrogenase, partial [Caulobacteraceae bacterium]|nr:sorbosone dehydrogenase [Caulobacteraceae bacterium]